MNAGPAAAAARAALQAVAGRKGGGAGGGAVVQRGVGGCWGGAEGAVRGAAARREPGAAGGAAGAAGAAAGAGEEGGVGGRGRPRGPLSLREVEAALAGSVESVKSVYEYRWFVLVLLRRGMWACFLAWLELRRLLAASGPAACVLVPGAARPMPAHRTALPQ